MASDKRQFPRIAKLLEAKWIGSSGGSLCRIADISWGGCFIQTPAEPALGEHTVIVTTIGGREVRLSGSVVYREAGIGFSIKFGELELDQIDVLMEILGELPERGDA